MLENQCFNFSEKSFQRIFAKITTIKRIYQGFVIKNLIFLKKIF